MKHLLKKINSRGGGKKPKVTPAVLNPPKIGNFQFGASFSIAENIDLISDGPIEGLVDPEGNLLPPTQISRGVYLDGTAVSVATDNFESEKPIENAINIKINIDEFSGKGRSFDNFAPSAFRYRYHSLENHFMIHAWSTTGGLKPTYRSLNKDEHKLIEADADGSYWPNGLFYGPQKDEYSAGANQHPKSVGYVQLNESDFSTSTLIHFYGGAVYENQPKIGVNVNNLKFFFDQRDGASSKGAMTPFIELLDALKGLKNSNDETISNQPYYDLINNTLTNALGNYNWSAYNTQELQDIIFPDGIDDGHIVMYYPPRNILSSKANQVITSPENLKFELANSANIPVPLDNNGYVKGYNILVPELQKVGDEIQLTGNVIGAYILHVPTKLKRVRYTWGEESTSRLPANFVSFAKTINNLSLTQKINSNLKYNYTNILIEQKLGQEKQGPLSFFNKVSIDKRLNRILYGPYRTEGQVQRIKRDVNQNKDFFFMSDTQYDGPNLTLENGIPTNEGSRDDEREGKDSNSPKRSFTSWNSSNSSSFNDEEGVPVVHVIHNPNVAQASITLQINSLFDSVEKDYRKGSEDAKDFRAGDKLPGIVNIEVEVGIVKNNGTQEPFSSRTFRIAALVESVTLLDIGNPDQLSDEEAYKHVRDTSDVGKAATLNVPFDLPSVYSTSLNAVDGSFEKRYVKISKLSTETFSVLISKDITLAKVTEIIPSYFTYPFSAVFGTKVDTRTFNNIPERTYDARLKKIRIPSNYFPVRADATSKDKRYYKTEKELEESTAVEKQLYNGDWDGTFKEGWTDNPAWILFDLLTSSRYGLGQQVEETEINKWELYKIGRFCDAVDDNGNFVGVPDGRGGLEPRFSCNILFNSKEKIFDAIQTISNLFRGKTFFRNSEISFLDQRVKSPIATFSNINVKDGLFNYSNFRRDQQFNTVEVAYRDRFENFAPKIEVIEDAEDIRNRGVFKTSIEAVGVTSRAMARRIGQHLIYKTIKENQRIAFTSGLEAMLCQPGDLIIIDDELKSNKSNFGKVMEVDTVNETIRLSGPYSDSTMTGILTVYNPTGEASISGLNDIANKKRQRHESFTITGSPDSSFDIFTGDYAFSGYKSGYDLSSLTAEELLTDQRFEEYALYTGTGENILYFNTEFTGWVFATGLAYQDNNTYDKFISDTGVNGNTLDIINQNSGVYDFSTAETDRRVRANYRDLTEQFSGLGGYTVMSDGGGILESEIGIGSPSQIVTLNVTGTVGSVSGERGSLVSGVDKPEYLSLIKLGSPYRYEVKEASDIIYQIDSIKEEKPNEYLVAGIKFDTGKYDLIENDISIERKENTFAYEVSAQVGDKTYTTLDSPTSLTLTTGEDAGAESFYISGKWPQVTNNNGYNVNLHYPNGTVEVSGIEQDITGVKFTGIESVGNFLVSVKAKGDTTSDSANAYFDSDYTTARSFFLYENITTLDRPSISNLTFR